MDCTSASTQSESPIPGGSPEVSIIVPARNEEVSLGDCLRSLVNQTGVNFEIIVVDDGSTDQTCVIAESFPGVRVISVGVLPPGWTGKNNAVAAGAREATGSWLLFTDADTIHVPGALARSLAEAKTENADMLSYSPEQIVGSFAEKVVTPVVFAELASEYPPEKVREEHSGVAAANGQYILVRRAAYEMAGGHTAVAKEILEDVVLAKIFRRTGLRVFFRYGGDAVRARMYHNWAQLRDGWTKNLALLFPYPRRRAAILTAWWLIGWLTLPLLIPAVGLFWRIRRAHFSLSTTILATAFGPPVFAFLLLRSRSAHLDGKVSWKGRDYAQSGLTHSAIHEAVRKGKPVLRTNS